MTVGGRSVSWSEGAAVISVAAALVAIGYGAAVWHASMFASSERLQALELRVLAVERACH